MTYIGLRTTIPPVLIMDGLLMMDRRGGLEHLLGAQTHKYRFLRQKPFRSLPKLEGVAVAKGEKRKIDQSAVKRALSQFENEKEPFFEHSVSGAIRKLRVKNDKSEPPMEWLAEYMAFDFYEDRSEDGSVWGTYFGPMWSSVNEDGTAVEFPSIKSVTENMLDYWDGRARQSKHPILKARYAALVWDFSKEVTNKSANIKMAQIWIDSVIKIAETDCHKYESDVAQKLEKVLSLAIGIKDQPRIEDVKKCDIEL